MTNWQTVPMELRSADLTKREIIGAVVPYNTKTYLVRDPAGEAIARGAFTKSITQRPTKIPLFLNHDNSTIHGWSKEWTDTPDSLIGLFGVREGDAGDRILIDARDGYLPGMSIDFQPLVSGRDSDGTRVIRDAKLCGVSLVTIPAYDDARVLETRHAAAPVSVASLFGDMPVIDLSPFDMDWR